MVETDGPRLGPRIALLGVLSAKSVSTRDELFPFFCWNTRRRADITDDDGVGSEASYVEMLVPLEAFFCMFRGWLVVRGGGERHLLMSCCSARI